MRSNEEFSCAIEDKNTANSTYVIKEMYTIVCSLSISATTILTFLKEKS